MVAVKMCCAVVPRLTHVYIVLDIAEPISCFLPKYVKALNVGFLANINESINQLINQSIFV